MKIERSFEGMPVLIIKENAGIFLSLEDVAVALHAKNIRGVIISSLLMLPAGKGSLIKRPERCYPFGNTDNVLSMVLHKAGNDMQLARRFLKWFMDTILAIKFIQENDGATKQLQELYANADVVFSITQIAKMYGMSAIALNEILHDKGVQFKVNNQWVLYSSYEGLGLTQTYKYKKSNGKVILHTYWTEKGLAFIQNLMNEMIQKGHESQKQLNEQLNLF